MSSAQPVRPEAPRAREVRPSVLAALQLVEDARYLGGDQRNRRRYARGLVERTIADRRLARDLRAG